MTRSIAAIALGLGLLTTAAPAATACDWEHCPGTGIVCGVVGCPVYCVRSPVQLPAGLGYVVCVL